MCQDTGTAIIMGKKGPAGMDAGRGTSKRWGRACWTPMKRTICATANWPRLSMFEERNTRTNLPAQIDIAQEGDDAYKLQFHGQGRGVGE